MGTSRLNRPPKQPHGFGATLSNREEFHFSTHGSKTLKKKRGVFLPSWSSFCKTKKHTGKPQVKPNSSPPCFSPRSEFLNKNRQAKPHVFKTESLRTHWLRCSFPTEGKTRRRAVGADGPGAAAQRSGVQPSGAPEA